MILNTLYLRNFRNYEEQTVSFGPKVNLIEGGNAQGKTNLLEAVYLLSCGRSFRTPHLADLIRHGSAFFYLEAHFVKDHIPQVLKVSFDGKIKKIQHNNTDYSTFSSLLGLLPSVLYAPEDISVVTGLPGERRRFIDLHIAQFDPLYVHYLLRYFKAMKQRNFLLRQKSEAGIEAWEHSMAASGSYLMQKRLEAVALLNPHICANMQQLSANADLLELAYQPAAAPDDLQMQFQKQRRREMHVGMTLIGPHRDDLIILINQKPAKMFSSEGQKSCCAAAIRLAEWHRLKQLNAAPPLMSIDDFGIRLDPNRSQFLQELIKTLGQTFLTSPLFLPGSLANNEKTTLCVDRGRIKY